MDLLHNFKNKVFHIDVLELLKMLPDNSVEFIYGDPDYNVGIKYAGKKYTKAWDKYIDWYIELAKESYRVLKKEGNMFLLNYPKQNAHLRVKYADENTYDVQEYVWIYNTNVGHTHRRFTTAHRSILHITKSVHNFFYKEQVAQPYQNLKDKRIIKRIADGNTGRMPYSWFYFDLVKNVSKDKTLHACQIPLGLVELMIKASTKENDNCLILFGGSGSELVLSKQLERNFISAEIHKTYYDMILDRLQNDGTIKDEYKLKLRNKTSNNKP